MGTPAAPHGCVDPARVSPLHLPALAHTAADLDGLDAPVRIVNPAALDRCGDCAAGDDIPELGAIATVVAYDAHGFGYRTEGCALHLPGVVRHFQGHGWSTVVEVPTCSRQWFERSDRETYWALDEARGVAVVPGMWDTWTVVEATDGYGAGRALTVYPHRVDAERWAQDHAARLAADAYEAASADTVAPSAATEVAA